jgi:hypothetical protein
MASLPRVMPRLRRGEPRAERIDALGWTAGTCIDSYGVRIGIRVNAPELLERLVPHLPPGWTPGRSTVVDRLFSLWVDPRPEGPRRRSRLYGGCSRLARVSDPDEALAILESEVRQTVAARSRRRVFVHAGVVGWRGRAIVIPGRSRSGKTTLVAELVKAGADYYSDEFAVLDSRGRVSPFPKPLSIRGPGGCDVHARKRTAEELGGVSGRVPLRVGLVVLAPHRPGGKWRPVRLSAGRAVLEMLAHTVPARRRPEASLQALERAVEQASVLRGRRGEAGETARQLLAWLDAAGPDPRPRMGRSRGRRPKPAAD